MMDEVIMWSRYCIAYGCTIRPSLFGGQTWGSAFYFKKNSGSCMIFWKRCSKMAPDLELLCSL